MKKLFTLLCAVALISLSICGYAQSMQYLHFDGTDDYTVTSNGSELVANEPAFSMTGWFYTDALVYGQGMMGFRSGTNGFYLIQLADGILECRLNSSTGLHEYVSPSFTVLPEQWQHYAWVYDGTAVYLYVDGINVGSSAASGIITEDNVPFAVGRSILSSLDFYFGGRADEVTLWSKALNPFEIGSIKNNGPNETDPALQLYYKFNQGLPGADNSSITHAISEIGSPDRDAELLGFALDGEESNFNGELDASFQAITFPTLENKLITDAPFTLAATASSGLDVTYTVISGPATISASTVTLDGTAGEVLIEATQIGDGTFTAATPVTQSFQVIDPQQNVPHIRVTNPTNGDMVAPNLNPIHMAAIVDIDFPELFEVTSVEFEIDGEIVPATLWKPGHYTAYWTPFMHDTYAITVRAFNNFGAAATSTVNVNILPTATDIDAHVAFSGIIINTPNPEETVTASLPTFLGAYNNITAHLDVNCPPGEACGEWDRVAHIDVKTHEGEWIELIKYITPYGTACEHSLDVTDFASTLQGDVDFRVRCTTFDTGYEYNLTLDYEAGNPEYVYSFITPLWHGAYDFGDPANLQPMPAVDFTFADNVEAAEIKLVASGHGWGQNNSNNAAEFAQYIHDIMINDQQTFSYNNWADCNPNPDGCQPQFGTWEFDRAGFCPGAISPFEDFNITPFIAEEQIALNFRMDQSYSDACHPNAPNCVDGVTPTYGGYVCQNCDDGFNPHLIFASTLITYSSAPFLDNVESSVSELEAIELFISPNPATDILKISSSSNELPSLIKLLDVSGRIILMDASPVFTNGTLHMDVSAISSGMYQLHAEYKSKPNSVESIVIGE